jgi:hypothetical protein
MFGHEPPFSRFIALRKGNISLPLDIHLAFSGAAAEGQGKYCEGKFQVMRRAKLLAKLAAFAMLAVVGGALVAQDAMPETPPELRAFRLDPERAQPQSEPATAPAPVAPPAAPPPAPKMERPVEPPATPSPSARASEPPVPIKAASAVAAPPPETPPPPIAKPREVTDQIATAPDDMPVVQPTGGLAFTWQMALALGLTIVLLAGWLMSRRHRVGKTGTGYSSINMPQPVVPALSDMPKMTLDFTPEKATVSFTSLTVKGQLRVVNESYQPVTAIELRTGLMTASVSQARQIADFHRLSAGVIGEPLGDARPRETIAMAIELSVPLSEMERFPVGEHTLLVPIVVANLSYHIEGRNLPETSQLACIVGREARPPAAKMGPLRLDLGPRSFAALGQRPLRV